MTDQPKRPTRRAPQRPIGVTEDIWRDALAIAAVLDERDNIGTGVPVVVRRFLAQYVAKHQDVLPPF